MSERSSQKKSVKRAIWQYQRSPPWAIRRDVARLRTQGKIVAARERVAGRPADGYKRRDPKSPPRT
jgi:hypothetical protein